MAVISFTSKSGLKQGVYSLIFEPLWENHHHQSFRNGLIELLVQDQFWTQESVPITILALFKLSQALKVWPFLHKHQFFLSKIVIFLLNFSQFFAFSMLLFRHQATQRPHVWPKVNFVKPSRGFGRYLNHWLTFESKVRAQSWTKFSLI